MLGDALTTADYWQGVWPSLVLAVITVGLFMLNRRAMAQDREQSARDMRDDRDRAIAAEYDNHVRVAMARILDTPPQNAFEVYPRTQAALVLLWKSDPIEARKLQDMLNYRPNGNYALGYVMREEVRRWSRRNELPSAAERPFYHWHKPTDSEYCTDECIYFLRTRNTTVKGITAMMAEHARDVHRDDHFHPADLDPMWEDDSPPRVRAA